MSSRSRGLWGEEAAVSYLRSKGYEILDRNFSSRYGEIDIIARKGKLMVFVEVKLRNSDSFGMGYESIDRRKIERIRRTAEYYIFLKKVDGVDFRFDVVSIDLKGNDYVFEHIEGAF